MVSIYFPWIKNGTENRRQGIYLIYVLSFDALELLLSYMYILVRMKKVLPRTRHADSEFIESHAALFISHSSIVTLMLSLRLLSQQTQISR